MTKWITVSGLMIAAALTVVYRPLFSDKPASSGNDFDLAALVLQSAEGGFETIEHPWNFRFPTDHGGHDGYRTETWQLSGVLETVDGQRFGLQFTVARIRLDSSPGVSNSGWDSGQIYAGQLLLSDPRGTGPLTSERLVRRGPGLAGWQAGPLRLWIEDWSVRQVDNRDRTPELELRIAADEFRLSLRLQDQQGLVSGEDLAGSGGERRPPFAFYIQPRLAAHGELRRGERVFDVSGSLSIEHAWGELPLPGGPLVRDRFSFYLDDGRVLLLARSHRRDGSGTPTAFGLVTQADGATRALGEDQIGLQALDAIEPGNFPLRWQLHLPDEALELEFTIDGNAGEGSGSPASLSGVVELDSQRQTPAGFGFAHLEGYHD